MPELPRAPFREDDLLRVLLVQQTSLFRTALAAVLSAEDDIEVVGDCSRVNEAIRIAGSVQPEVAVIDLDLLTDTDSGIVGQLQAAVPDCAILILAGSTFNRSMHDALHRYTGGFVSRDNTPSQLAAYIRKVAAGESVIDPALAVSALAGPHNPLKEREREVLRIAGTGASSPEIAAKLHLSVGTVRNYLSAIMQKTGGRNRLEAFHIADEAGWL